MARTCGLFEYFWKMTEARRKEPRDDIASVLTHATLDGKGQELVRLGISAKGGKVTTFSDKGDPLVELGSTRDGESRHRQDSWQRTEKR